jgi:hypothetical protein
MKKYLLVCFLILASQWVVYGQTFTFANYNTSPGAGSTSNYTEVRSGITMTVATTTSGATGWTALCSVNSPGYLSSSCYGAIGLSRSVNWGNLTSSVTTTITFSSPISCASFNIFDINRNSYNGGCINLFTDVVDISGDNSGTAVSPVITQSATADQTVSGTTTKTITGTEGSAGGAVTVSFGSNINRIVIVYKSAASISSSLGCSGGSSNPRNQYIVIGAISGSSANYGTLNGGNVTSCISIDPSPIVFSSFPSGSPTYQWYSKAGINSCPTGTGTSGWTSISGATGSSLDPGSISSSITYACLVSVGGCGSPTWANGCKTITVDNTNATSSPTMSNGDYLWQGVPSSAVANIIVDDTAAVFTGTWSASANAGFYAVGSKNSSYSGGAATATVTYYPEIITPGNYEVYERHLSSSSTFRRADAPITIKHGSGTVVTSVDQTTNNTSWVSIGTYYFNAGNDGYIRLDNGRINAGSQVLNTDAIRLVFRGTNVYETASNWLEFNGTNFIVAPSAPSSSDNVFIKQTGTCVNGYPQVTTTGAQANNLTISGSSAQITSNNATTLTVAGNWSSTGQYNENQGKIVFTGSGKTITTNVFEGETFYNVDFNNGSSISMNSDVNVLNALGLAGTVTTGSKVFWLKNSAGDATSLPDFSGKIVGTFKRDIANNTSTYSFPVARTTDGTRYLAQIINSNMNGVSFINGSVRALTESGNNVDSRIVASQGDLLTNVIEGSIWSLVPNTQPTSGSYGVRLYNTSGLPDNKFCPVKRPGGSSDYNQWDTFQGTTLIPNAGSAGRTASSGYAERLGYTSFSEHAIATTPGTLPVKLSFFKANCTNKTQAEIKWQTLTERNSERFEIEKSLDGDIFNVIANIPAAGNSNNPINYAYIDNLNLNETTYYRLNQYDLDGTKNILEVKSINCENNTLDLNVVFPVPVVENLNATISSSYNRLVKLEIYNAIGQVVYFNSLNIETGNNRVTLNNFEIANGAYLLKISDNADNSLFVAKQFVINK